MGNRHEHLPARALVWDDGAIEQLDDGRGASLLAEFPELLAYAGALVRTGLERLAFVYHEPGRPWLLVRLACVTPGADERSSAVVELDARSQAPFALTQRELDVLTLLTGGLTNPDPCARLHTSRSTVSTHVERVLAKLRQRSRAGAAAVALEQGLLRLPIPGGAAGFEHLAIGVVQRATADDTRAIDSAGPRRRARRRPLLIGVVTPGDGLAGDRDEPLNGGELAIAQLNERGGVLGGALERQLVDVAIDDPASIRDGLRALVDLEVDVIMLGYTWAEDTSIYSATTDYGCPVLTCMTSEAQATWVSEDPTSFGHVFQVGSTERPYGTGFFRVLDELRRAGKWRPANRRVLCVQTPVAGGQFLDERALAAGADLGWEVERILRVSNAGADWRETLDAIRASAAAAVLIGHFVPAEVARFQRLFVAEPSDTLIHCIYAPSVPEYIERAGAAAEGVVWSTVAGTYSDRIGRAFRKRYADRFGRLPGESLAGVGYDQVNLIANAWARAGNPRAFSRVTHELRALVHRGVNGVYSLGNPRQTSVSYPDETPDPSLGLATLVFQIQGGQARIISPVPYAETGFKLPAWFSSNGITASVYAAQ